MVKAKLQTPAPDILAAPPGARPGHARCDDGRHGHDAGGRESGAGMAGMADGAERWQDAVKRFLRSDSRGAAALLGTLVADGVPVPTLVTGLPGRPADRGFLIDVGGEVIGLAVGAGTHCTAALKSLPSAQVPAGDAMERLAHVMMHGRPTHGEGLVPKAHEFPSGAYVSTTPEEMLGLVDAYADGVASPLRAEVRCDLDSLLSEAVTDHLCEAMPKASKALFDLVRPAWTPRREAHVLAIPLSPRCLRQVVTCARMPRPDWVLQAVLRHHVFQGLLVEPHSTPGTLDPHLAAIAAGASPMAEFRSLLARLAGPSAAGLPEAAVRSVSHFPFDKLMSETGGWPMTLPFLRALFETVPEQRSLTAAEVGALSSVGWLDGSGMMGCHGERHGAERRAAIASALREGDGFGPIPAGLPDAYRSLLASLSALARAVSGGSRRRTDAWVDDELKHLLACRVAFPPHRRLRTLARIDRDWHATIQTHEEALARLCDDVGARLGVTRLADLNGMEYPHLSDGPVDIGGVVATPLRTKAAFLAEGREMDHCVASSANSALRARVAVFSLADPEGGRSTAAYHLSLGKVALQEHRSVGNAEPTRSHATAAADLRARLAMDAEVVARFKASRDRLGTDPVKEGLDGHEPFTPAERERFLALHFANVSHWLSKSDAALGPADYVRSLMPEELTGSAGVRLRCALDRGLGRLCKVVGRPRGTGTDMAA